jgi:hypothetical protein
MVIKFKIEKASAKMRSGGPLGDEEIKDEVWSGEIPLAMKAMQPILDNKFGVELPMTESVKKYFEKNK